MLDDIKTEFGRYQKMAETTLPELDDAAFFERPGEAVNPIALIVKHVGGNLRSRWTDFLTTDGEKPDRNRDGEFLIHDGDTRDRLMEIWHAGWNALWSTLNGLSDADFDRITTIRGEKLTVRQAALRSATHTAYHVGQILYVARLLRPDREWLTIAPGKSQSWKGQYLPPKKS
jgi:Protein of unknown function (DUF1572)